MIDELYLRSLRKNGADFTDINKYSCTIRNILEDGKTIPVVIGYYECKPENLEILHISPYTEADQMRVRNFCVGVDAYIKEFEYNKHAHWKYLKEQQDFHARINVGIDTRTTAERGRSVFGTGFTLGGIDYDLHIIWDGEETHSRKIFYKSKSYIGVPESFKIISPFIGPNFEMRR